MVTKWSKITTNDVKNLQRHTKQPQSDAKQWQLNTINEQLSIKTSKWTNSSTTGYKITTKWRNTSAKTTTTKTWAQKRKNITKCKQKATECKTAKKRLKTVTKRCKIITICQKTKQNGPKWCKTSTKRHRMAATEQIDQTVKF